MTLSKSGLYIFMLKSFRNEFTIHGWIIKQKTVLVVTDMQFVQTFLYCNAYKKVNIIIIKKTTKLKQDCITKIIYTM